MDEKQKPAAIAKPDEAKAAGHSAGAPPAAGDLDLQIEEIQRPELMKEGFVGQER